jgi:hypothetical protein
MKRNDWAMALLVFFAIGQVMHWYSLWKVGQSTGAFPRAS